MVAQDREFLQAYDTARLVQDNLEQLDRDLKLLTSSFDILPFASKIDDFYQYLYTLEHDLLRQCYKDQTPPW